MLFSEYYNISERQLDDYGALDISLACDLPLYIDPSLIFSSKNNKYDKWYESLVKYFVFLDYLGRRGLSRKEIKYFFSFKEVKQNWLGVSLNGNAGLALGEGFAIDLYNHISRVCDTHNVSNSIHVEKLFLIKKGVGKDKISDMVYNILLEYFISYTERFAKENISPSKCAYFFVSHAKFNYEFQKFEDIEAYLPFITKANGKKDFVLLTPKDILRKDQQAISYDNLVDSYEKTRNVIDNDSLKVEVETIINGFLDALYAKKTKERGTVSNTDIKEANKEGFLKAVERFPELYDYFIKLQEQSGKIIRKESEEEVQWISRRFLETYHRINERLPVYSLNEIDSFDESMNRALFLKNEIEVNSLWKNLYIDSKPIASENDLQRLFRLVWFGSKFMLIPEGNGGAGPVDFVVTKGRDSNCLVEFKLASNSKLLHVFDQVNQYEKSLYSRTSIIMVFFFTDEELRKVIDLREFAKRGRIEIPIIDVDCRNANKKSASKI